jgi:hypothetical protein
VILRPQLSCINGIPALDEECHNDPNATQEASRSSVSCCFGLVRDVEDIVYDSADQVASTEPVKGIGWYAWDIRCHDRSRKETNVLESVLLSAFSSDDLSLGLMS